MSFTDSSRDSLRSELLLFKPGFLPAPRLNFISGRSILPTATPCLPEPCTFLTQRLKICDYILLVSSLIDVSPLLDLKLLKGQLFPVLFTIVSLGLSTVPGTQQVLIHVRFNFWTD